MYVDESIAFSKYELTDKVKFFTWYFETQKNLPLPHLAAVLHTC